MKLKFKTAGLIGLLMGLFIIGLFIFIRPFILSDAQDMDKESLRIDVLRVSNYLESSANDLQRLNRDWAIWDDTYEFILDRNQKYISSNIMLETYENNAINLMVYLDNKQEVVYSEAYDLENGEELDFILSRSFIQENWNSLQENGEALIIDHEKVGPVLLVSQQVLTSQGEGPSVGVLMMGKLLNNQFFESMESELAVDIDILMNEQVMEISQTLIAKEQEEFLVDIVPISGSMALEVKGERKYYNEKLSSMNDLFLTLLLAALLLIFSVYYLLDLFVLSRISLLSGQLKNIDFDQPNSLKLKKLKSGKDEINDLEKSVHCMLGSLEKAHSNVTKIAYFDYLTDLPNRFSLTRDFDKRTGENSVPFAVLFFDLDGFKRVNDLYGHSSGDELLQQVARRLKAIQNVRSDRLYRIGGDEFVFLIHYSHKQSIVEVLEIFMSEIRKEFILSNVNTSISSSVGISFYPEDSKSLRDLLHFADNAMYEAKKSGKNNYCFYQELENKEKYKYQVTLKENLMTAISSNEFYLEYQPIFNVTGKYMSRVEALVRWKHPVYGIVSPLQFIPLAEEIGTIRAVGNWVLRKAVQDIAEWNLKNEHSLGLAVNVSNYQLKYKEELLLTIDSALKENNFSADMLQIEITESDTVVEKGDVVDFIKELKQRGIRIALDDFGVGSSSLFQLTSLDVDVVKIDRHFLKEVPRNSKDTILLRGIFEILNNLGIEVVTEGIETSHQLEFVVSQQISYLQGYYLSRPVPLKSLLEINSELSGKIMVTSENDLL